MNWEREYEHWRDRGHTWGPGIDDRREPTEEEIESLNSYQEMSEKLSYKPRAEVCAAAKELEILMPKYQDVTSGKAPYDWRKRYSKAKIEQAKKAAESLGYELKIREWKSRDENKFMVAIEYHGYLAHKEGNIHTFSVANIKSIHDCLQLVADFSELGYWPTTWYKKNHISLRNTGELRLEMKCWGFPLEETKKPSLDEQITGAAGRTANGHADNSKAMNFDPER